MAGGGDGGQGYSMSILSRLARLRGATIEAGGLQLSGAGDDEAGAGQEVEEEEEEMEAEEAGPARLVLNLGSLARPGEETYHVKNDQILGKFSDHDRVPRRHPPPWRSVGEVHRSYRERARGPVEKVRSKMKSDPLAVSVQPAPFYSGGRIATVYNKVQEAGHSRRRRAPEEMLEEESWELPSPPKQQSQPYVAPTSALVEHLDYGAYCLDVGGYRQNLLNDLRRLLRDENLTVTLVTKPEGVGSPGEGAILLKTVFMAGIGVLTTNFDGIYPEISREERGGTISFRMVLHPRQRS